MEDLPREVLQLHPIVLEIGLGIPEGAPVAIHDDAIAAARQVLLELAGTDELRHAVRSLIACMSTLAADHRAAADQIMALLHEPDILAAIRALPQDDAGAKAFTNFADRPAPIKPPHLEDARPANTLTIQQLSGVKRYL